MYIFNLAFCSNKNIIIIIIIEHEEHTSKFILFSLKHESYEVASQLFVSTYLSAYSEIKEYSFGNHV